MTMKNVLLSGIVFLAAGCHTQNQTSVANSNSQQSDSFVAKIAQGRADRLAIAADLIETSKKLLAETGTEAKVTEAKKKNLSTLISNISDLIDDGRDSIIFYISRGWDSSSSGELSKEAIDLVFELSLKADSSKRELGQRKMTEMSLVFREDHLDLMLLEPLSWNAKTRPKIGLQRFSLRYDYQKNYFYSKWTAYCTQLPAMQNCNPDNLAHFEKNMADVDAKIRELRQARAKLDLALALSQ